MNNITSRSRKTRLQSLCKNACLQEHSDNIVCEEIHLSPVSPCPCPCLQSNLTPGSKM